MDPLPIQIIIDPYYLALMIILTIILTAWAAFSCTMQVLEYHQRARELEQEVDQDPHGFTASGETKKIPTIWRKK